MRYSWGMKHEELKQKIEAAGIRREAVAVEANVSVRTVDHYFAGDALRPLMKSAVEQAAERLLSPTPPEAA